MLKKSAPPADNYNMNQTTDNQYDYREAYNKAIQDCNPELTKARSANTGDDVEEVKRHLFEVINILLKVLGPFDPQPHYKD